MRVREHNFFNLYGNYRGKIVVPKKNDIYPQKAFLDSWFKYGNNSKFASGI